jgi:uncharacterized protein YlxW (UPF0749 family)
MPAAGRKPDAHVPDADDDADVTVVTAPVSSGAGEPAVTTPRAATGSASGPDDEVTTLLVPPPVTDPLLAPPVADDDEPTVEARAQLAPQAPEGGGTGDTDAAGVAAPESAGEPGTDAGSLDPVVAGAVAATVPSGDAVAVPEHDVDLRDAEPKPAPWRRLSSAGALIWVLLALFGFTLVVQLRSNNADQGLATARQEDLVRILSDLEARDQRLQAEINTLEQSQRTLTSGVEGRQAALAEANKRADELGLLAGTLPGRGPGLRVVIDPGDKVKASAVLNAVQELRGAGGEVMQITGADGGSVRIVASTYFVDATNGGIVVDGKRLTGPYTLWVIGVPQTMQTALQIPGGVVASVNSLGGSVTMEPRTMVEVTAVRKATSLQYARPVS